MCAHCEPLSRRNPDDGSFVSLGIEFAASSKRRRKGTFTSQLSVFSQRHLIRCYPPLLGDSASKSSGGRRQSNGNDFRTEADTASGAKKLTRPGTSRGNAQYAWDFKSDYTPRERKSRSEERRVGKECS